MNVISTRQWLDDGGTRRDLRRRIGCGELVPIKRGYVMEAAAPDREALHRGRIEAAASSLRPSTAFSLTSAALIHGLPLLSRRHDRVEVIWPAGSHGQITGTMHARAATLAEDEITEVDGLSVTSLARTVEDLVRRLPFLEAVMIADAALRRGLAREDLLVRTAKGRGCRMAARALEFADGRAESPGESVSRVRMHQAGLPAPDLQRALYDASGRLLARVDFWWEHVRLVGEFDGKIKYEALVPNGKTAADVIMDEKRREQALRDAGFEVVRWTWDDLWRPGLTGRINQAMARQSRRAVVW